MKKRAMTMTTPEVSAIFFAIGFLLMIFIVRNLLNMYTWATIRELDSLAGTLMLQTVILFMMLFFFLISVAFPNYQIVKNNLFLLMDRITNPDYMGWFGFNRNKKFYPQIVKTGSFGQTKGVMNDEKADVINDGMYTAILPNGNQVLIVNDLLSTNIDLNNALGWNLINKHFGVLGFKAYELAVSKGEVLHNFVVSKEKPVVVEEVDVVAEEK